MPMSKRKVQNQPSLLNSELRNIRNFMLRLRVPSEKEYSHLLAMCIVGLSAMGLIGYGVKFVHMIINKLLIGEDSIK